jgi:hypothetical protein
MTLPLTPAPQHHSEPPYLSRGRGYGLDVPSSGWGPSSIQWGGEDAVGFMWFRGLKMSGAISPVPPYVFMLCIFAGLSNCKEKDPSEDDSV